MSLGYVGLPCQMEALRKVGLFPGAKWANEVGLSIGLFCRENWAYTCFRALVQDDFGVDLKAVKKFDIKKGNILAVTEGGETVEIPLRVSKPYVRVGCLVCLDFTAELSDVSCGAVGSPDGWSTVIIRTARGEEVVEGAAKEGYIETKAIEEVKPGLNLIKRIAKDKLEKNTEEANAREKEGIKVPHISTQGEKDIEKLKAAAKEKGFEDLEEGIIKTGLCISCGACVAACPRQVLEMKDERPMKIEECKDCGICYRACPRTSLPKAAIEERMDLPSRKDGLLGRYRKILAVRAKDGKVRDLGEDGGAATALLLYALDKGLIEGAITAGGKSGEEPWRPVASLVKSKKELFASSGTWYSYATNLPELKAASKVQK